MSTDETMNVSVENSPEPNYDYDSIRQERTLPAIIEILNYIGTNNYLVVDPTKVNEIEYNDVYNDASKVILEILTVKNVPFMEYQFVFEYLQNIIMTLGDIVGKQRRGHEREILSRIIGAKNPGTGKFDIDHANYGHLLSSVLDVRKNTGDDIEDYFHVKPKK